MLTGKVPEPAMDRLFSDGLKRPGELGVKVTPAVSEAIMRGLAVKKEDRIQSVRELMDALYTGKKLKKRGNGKLFLEERRFRERDARRLVQGLEYRVLRGQERGKRGREEERRRVIFRSHKATHSGGNAARKNVRKSGKNLLTIAIYILYYLTVASHPHGKILGLRQEQVSAASKSWAISSVG